MASQIILKGSQRDHAANSVASGKPAFDKRGSITCVLRRKNAAPRQAEVCLTRDSFAAEHGCDISDIHAVEAFAAQHGFTVDAVHAGSRTVKLSGSLHDMAGAFGTTMELRAAAEGIYESHAGPLSLPAELSGIIVGILGLDERPAASPRHQVLNRLGDASYTPVQVAKAYNFPTNKGTNQTIALIELGGGYKQPDLTTYWRQMGIGNVSVTAVSVGGGSNTPSGDPSSADGEVALDIEVAGAIAPGARIAVYFAPNTEQGFLDVINAAIHDQVRKPSVISISWGSPESNWTPQVMDAFSAAFHDAAMLGITVCAAAGDNGSNDGVGDGKKHVDFPASSPWVLACGGTRLQASGDKIITETVWNDGAQGGATGGGVSSHFAKPDYQKGLKIGKRGVPDIAGNADPESGYLIVVDGQSGVIGGTSAVAPLWAALIALMNEELGTNAGFLHPHLYGAEAQPPALHDITHGNNGRFKAGKGWDGCTGLGTPDGQALLSMLKTKLKK